MNAMHGLAGTRRFLGCALGVAVYFTVASALQAQTLSYSISSTYYGYLDQYNINTENSLIGDDACVPTSTTNALVLLQNLNPTIFGTGLAGSTYQDWHETDRQLIQAMGTTANNGTSYIRIPYGLNDYLNNLSFNYTSNLTLSGQFSTGGWDLTYPKPSYITAEDPTADFIYNALQNLNGVLLSIDYSTHDGTYTSGGHELLACGITWDLSSSTGTISFIDPLNPSQNYSSTTLPDGTYEATGPALVTTGTITLLGSGSGSPGSLLLEYDQYNGDDTAPISDGPFYHEYATIDNVFAIGAVAAVPEPSEYAAMVIFTLAGLVLMHRMRLVRQRA